MNFTQTVFTIFYAIFWGATANLHPRWRLFDWPQAKKHPRIDKRVGLAFLILNAIPFFYFWLAITLTSYVAEPVGASWFRYFLPLMAGISPAFAALGFYRLFLSIVGKSPEQYYWFEKDLNKTQLPLEKSIECLGLNQPGWEINMRVALKYIFVPVAIIALVLALQSYKPRPTPTKSSQNPQDSSTGKGNQPDADQSSPAPNSIALLQENSTPVKQKHRDEGQDQDNGASGNGWPWRGIAGGVNGILTLLFAGAVAFATTRQWLSMRQQAHLMEASLRATRSASRTAFDSARAAQKNARAAAETVNQMRLQQRAWLSIERLTIVYHAGDKIGCILSLSNSGTTPGIVERVRTQSFHERPSADSVPLRTSEIAEAMKSETAGENPVAPKGVAQMYSQIVDLKSGHLASRPPEFKDFFILARIQYRDVFGEDHVAQRCFLIDDQNAGIEYKYGNRMT
jgi:hypothetical protein